MKRYSFMTAFLCCISTFLLSQDFVLVHGWLGNGADWDNSGVEQLILGRSPNRVLKPSLDGNKYASVQSLNLRNYLSANNVNDGVAVSFSMGGMTTRYHLRRQFDQSAADRISQHYTIATPHFGSAVADNIPVATKILIIGAASALWPGWIEEEAGGYAVYHNFYPSYEMVVVLLGSPVFDAIINHIGGDALDDLSETSPAVNYINPAGGAYYENNMVKVGIAGTEIDPVSYRLAAGFLGEDEQTILDLKTTVETWKFVNMVNALIGYFENGHPPLPTVVGHIATYAYFVNLDWLWENKVVESSASDGIVKKTSQEYPNATKLYYANNMSHMEGRDNSDVILRLTEGLNTYTPLPTPPQINSFTQTPKPFNPEMEVGTVTCNASGSGLSYSWQAFQIPSGMSVSLNNTNTVSVTFSPVVEKGVKAPSIEAPPFELRCTVSNAAGSTTQSFYPSHQTVVWWKNNGTKQLLGEQDVPDQYLLMQNYPNPFNPNTTIRFALPESGFIRLSVYNIAGKIVKTLLAKQQQSGVYDVVWNGKNERGQQVPSGIYIYKLQAGQQQLTGKMLLTK